MKIPRKPKVKAEEVRKILDSLRRRGYNVEDISYSDFNTGKGLILSCQAVHSSDLGSLEKVLGRGIQFKEPKKLVIYLKTKKPTSIETVGMNEDMTSRVISLSLPERRVYSEERGYVTSSEDYQEIMDVFRKYDWQVKNESIRFGGIPQGRRKRRT